MLTTTVMVVVACDLCGHDGQDDETGGMPVFTDEAAALTWLMETGWQVAPGNKLTCHLCAAAMLCARNGHELGTWTDCLCAPPRSGHPTDHNGRCVRQFAWCDRCEHHEYRRRGSDVAAAS